MGHVLSQPTIHVNTLINKIPNTGRVTRLYFLNNVDTAN